MARVVKKAVVVERKIRRKYPRVPIHHMKVQDDLDEFLDRVFGEDSFPSETSQPGKTLRGKAVTPTGEELLIYGETS